MLFPRPVRYVVAIIVVVVVAIAVVVAILAAVAIVVAAALACVGAFVRERVGRVVRWWKSPVTDARHLAAVLPARTSLSGA